VLIYLVDPRRRKKHRQTLVDLLPVLYATQISVTTTTKRVLRPRRPVLDIVRAIEIGKKPNLDSVPSGHTDAGFAGANLLARHYPSAAPALYGIAVLTGLSRLYLGAHYPREVVGGTLSGLLLAPLYHRAWNLSRRRIPALRRLPGRKVPA